MLITLYKTYFWLFVIPVFAIVTILAALAAAIGCMLGGEKIFSYYPGMIWARAACILTLCRVTVKGRENIRRGQSYVFVANHQSAYDIFVIYGYLGSHIKWMMRKGLEKIPFVGFACRKCGFIFVDNSSARTAQKSIMEAESKLKNGRSLIIFPEGSRTKDGKMGKFKRGAYQIAVEMKLPLVPITLNGPFKVMRSNSFNIKPHRMEMIIHPEVEIPPYPAIDPSDSRQAMLAVKERLQTLVDMTRDVIYSDLWDEFK